MSSAESSHKVLANQQVKGFVWNDDSMLQGLVGHGAGVFAALQPLHNGCSLVRVPICSYNRVFHELLSDGAVELFGKSSIIIWEAAVLPKGILQGVDLAQESVPLT